LNNSGDAAEQIVRMSLEGVEVAARITGGAAKEIALMIIAAIKSDKEKTGGLKTKGSARLTSMLKSGKSLEIFTVKESDLKKFAQGAKQYGIVYCVLRNSKHTQDGVCDIMVKADDAPKISRLVERLKFAAVDKGKIESEIITEKAGRMETGKAPGSEPEAPDTADKDKLLDDLLGGSEGVSKPDKVEPVKPEPGKSEPRKSEPVKAAVKEANINPVEAETASPRPSEPISGNESKSVRGTSNKPSVKNELREITAAKKAKDTDMAKTGEHLVPDKPKNNPVATHKQPPRGGKKKSRKSKARS